MGQPPKPVIIVGAGWAGLAAAVELACEDIPFLLLEASSTPGGRAKSVIHKDWRIDNGQHLLLGAYQHTLAFMRRVGANPDDLLLRVPLTLHWQGQSPSTHFHLACPPFPYPWQWIVALLSARGISWPARFSSLWRSYQLIQRPCLSAISVAERLRQLAPWPEKMATLWQSLCLAILNTPPEEASFSLFQATLQRVFYGHPRQGDFLLPRVDLNQLFPQPALSFLESRAKHSQIFFNSRVVKLSFSDQRMTGVLLQNGDSIAADQVILAVPPHAAYRLLANEMPLISLAKTVQTLCASQSVTTVYLRYPHETVLDFPMIAIHGGIGQWVTDRQATHGEYGSVSVVISGNLKRSQPLHDIAAQVVAELAMLFPGWKAPLSYRILQEKRATFSATPQVVSQRPVSQSAMKGLWLAGDYTETHLPATLEGAVISGSLAARYVLDSL